MAREVGAAPREFGLAGGRAPHGHGYEVDEFHAQTPLPAISRAW